MNPVSIAVSVAIQAGLPVALRGKPGVGKTSMIEGIARDLNLHLEVVIGSLREPTDLAGLPIVGDDNTVHLSPPRWAVNAASAGNDSYREANLGSTSQSIRIGVITENTRGSESAQCSGLGCQVRVVRQAFPSETGLREIRGL